MWDIAKQNMDPIFRLDIDQSQKKITNSGLETIEESEESGLGGLKKNTKTNKISVNLLFFNSKESEDDQGNESLHKSPIFK
jgi:hypothetical protein